MVSPAALSLEVVYRLWLGEMSLRMGRGTRRVRSCGLVRKWDSAREAVAGRGVGRESSARFIGAVLHRDSRREQLTSGMCAPV